jgi:hypothetical protein
MLVKPKFTWNDETVDLLRREVANQLSAAEISVEFARYYAAGPSRNAIIGKCSRLNIPLGKAERAVEVAQRARPKRYFPWDDPTCDKRFRELIAAGRSSAQIALAMAASFPTLPTLTAGNVQMRAAIMRLSLARARIRAPIVVQPEQPIEPEPAPQPEPAAPEQQEPTKAAPFNQANLVTFMDLAFGMCRYPVGDPDPEDGQFFCGEQSKQGESYCGRCYAITHTRQLKRTPAQIEVDESRRRIGRLRLPPGTQWIKSGGRAHV